MDACKDLLIYAISLNLKLDWEKSKYEVKGDMNSLFEKLGLLFFAVTVEGLILKCIGFENYIALPLTSILIYMFCSMYEKISKLIILFEKGETVEFSKLNSRVRGFNTIICLCLICTASLLYMYNRPLQINFISTITTITGIAYY